MKIRQIIPLVLISTMVITMVACGGNETHINVQEDQLYGLWRKNNTQEYWRYKSDGTGVTWDEGDDITEEESNLTYSWTINGDRLTHVFTGAQGNQAVPKVYTVTEISSTSMQWKDDYSMEYSLTKVN